MRDGDEASVPGSHPTVVCHARAPLGRLSRLTVLLAAWPAKSASEVTIRRELRAAFGSGTADAIGAATPAASVAAGDGDCDGRVAVGAHDEATRRTAPMAAARDQRRARRLPTRLARLLLGRPTKEGL